MSLFEKLVKYRREKHLGQCGPRSQSTRSITSAARSASEPAGDATTSKSCLHVEKEESR
jgi:hypothetical protein